MSASLDISNTNLAVEAQDVWSLSVNFKSPDAKKKKNVKLLSCPVLSYPKIAVLCVKGPFLHPLVFLKTNVEHWCNYSDRGKIKLLGSKHVPLPLRFP
jgi:hypothetical protein